MLKILLIVVLCKPCYFYEKLIDRVSGVNGHGKTGRRGYRAYQAGYLTGAFGGVAGLCAEEARQGLFP